MNKACTTYNEGKKCPVEPNMIEIFEVKVDERTGERCLKGYDEKNKMKVTLLFDSVQEVDEEKVIIEPLLHNFLERARKQAI